MKKCLVCIDIYVVEPGDTIYSIAQSYNISTGLLMKVNRINDPYELKPGLRLCIPGFPDDIPAEPDEGPEELPTPELPPEAGHCKGTLYTIVDGDTLYMIAKKNRINLNALIDSNPGIDPYNLRVGDKLCIPR